MKKNLIFLFLVFASEIGSAQTLTLKVEGIENVKGYLYIGIYNSPESFMKKPVFGFRVPVQDSVMVVPCQGLPTGTYAISLFQDENENGVLDTGSFGRPTEKFGFSNNAEGVMGAPAYKKCVFEFRQDMMMKIQLK